jgi:diacylglycerol kinase (ATP)
MIRGRRTMAAAEKFSLAARVNSFRHALRGVRETLTTQHNARIHLVMTAAVCGLGWALGVSRLEWCALILAGVAVWVAELLNTALEGLADAVSPEPHPRVGRAKDAAAGAVLLAAAGASLVGLLVLGPPLLRWLE